jgi:class 3 adenylate cyclase
MKYLNNWNQINESDEKQQIEEETPSRSGRILTQAQREWKDDSSIERGENLPSVLFTDVEGSSEKWSSDPVTMMNQLKGHHELVDRISKKYNGWIVKTIGDAFMVYFESSPDSLTNAIKCGKEIILSEKNYNLRVGACQGPMQEDTYKLQKVTLRDFYGNSINVASRMESKIAGEAGYIAFTSIEPMSKNIIDGYSRTIGQVLDVDLSNFDLKGAKTESAYRIKVK